MEAAGDPVITNFWNSDHGFKQIGPDKYGRARLLYRLWSDGYTLQLDELAFEVDVFF